MNTHLHILEPYTNLFRVWNNEYLECQLRNLIELFTDRILDIETGIYGCFLMMTGIVDMTWFRMGMM